LFELSILQFNLFHQDLTDGFDVVWHKATEKTGVKIASQVLLVCRGKTLGERGVF
jgi:hypothetical protein